MFWAEDAAQQTERKSVMSLVFYSAPRSSASPVASALAELGIPHERVEFDLSKSDDHKKPEYLALNPNGTVPCLTVDGTPLFEALAILLWLGDRYGVERGLWPASSDPARLEALSWCTWAYVTYGSILGRLHFATNERIDPELHNKAQAELAHRELDRLLGLLEDRLTRKRYMLGSEFSLADLVVASVVGYSAWVGAPVSRHARVSAWIEEFQARPSYAVGMGSAA